MKIDAHDLLTITQEIEGLRSTVAAALDELGGRIGIDPQFLADLIDRLEQIADKDDASITDETSTALAKLFGADHIGPTYQERLVWAALSGEINVAAAILIAAFAIKEPVEEC